MIKFIKQFFVLFTLTLLISFSFGCTTDVPSENNETVSDSPNINQENQQNNGNQSTSTDQQNKEDEESKTPPSPPSTEETETPSVSPDHEEQNPPSEYFPEPNNITDSSIIKLNKDKLKNTELQDHMFLMLRFMGKSENGFWQQIIDIEKEIVAYPKGFVFYLAGNSVATVLNFNDVDEKYQQLVGYDTFSGFSKVGGGVLKTNFYYGDENINVNINGNNDITFTFASFAIWDPTINGEFMESSHPDFVRYPSNRFKIKIPMKDFDSDIYKNIAYVTIYFEPDKGTTDNLFPYVAVFDGFEKK